MKKLMLTTAITSLLVTSAFAQTTITGELRLAYKGADAKKGATGKAVYTQTALTGADYISVGRGLETGSWTVPTYYAVANGMNTAANATADTFSSMSNEQQVNVQTKGKLNIGGLEYAAGFSFENDGDQLTTLFNENVYMDITNPSSGTTISIGRDHIQRSDSDRSAAVLVGHSPNDLSQLVFKTTTLFQQNLGPEASQNYGIAVLQKTPVGTFSYNYVPENGVSAASEDVVPSTKPAYEAGFVGDFGVKGLEAYYFKSADIDTASTSINKAKADSYGVKYLMGQFGAGYAHKKHNAAATDANKIEITESQYGLSYAVDNNLSLGLLYAKANATGGSTGVASNMNGTQKVKAVQLGYALGPVDLTVSYARNTDVLEVEGNDSNVFMTRLIGKF